METGGKKELSRRKPNVKNRVADYIERASQALLQQGMMVSATGVRFIWLRNDLGDAKKRLTRRMKAFQEGVLLTEEPNLWNVMKQEKEACMVRLRPSIQVI